MEKEQSEKEKRVYAEWLVDKSILDNPSVRKSLARNKDGTFYEDDYKNDNTMKILRIRNPYNYLKWVIEENDKLKKLDTPQEIQDYEIIWAKDLKNYEEEEKEWIIDKLIPSRSVTILTGKRGTLKTFVTLAMCYSVSLGRDFLEQFPTKKGKVIYLDKENGISIMKKRTSMIENGLGLDDCNADIGFICFSQIKLDKLGGVTAIEKVIEEHKPKLLIVDTYRRSVGFDENDAGKVSALFVDTLRPIVEKNNTSIILIHHNRKGSGEGDEMDELRGSSDLANYADIILKLERNGGNVVFKQLKNRNAQELKPFKLNVKFEENSDSSVRIDYAGEFKKQTKLDKCIEVLTIWIARDEIKEFKTRTAKEIAFKYGIKETYFKSALKELENMGIIINVGFGLYEVVN